MRIIRLLFILPLLLSCGQEKTPVYPDVISNDLHEQISRITPLLLWCDGQATSIRNNNIDGRPNCDTGDGASESGFLTLVGNFLQENDMFTALSSSINSNNQPFRSPSYVDKDLENSFSRDQLLGFIEATYAGLSPQSGLSRITDYVRRTGKLCSNATDSRCDMSDSMWILVKDALGEAVSDVERWKDETVLNAEASTVPLNYQANLVSRKIFLKAIGNKLTQGYAHAAMLLNKRAPSNLWIKTVFFVTNRGTKSDFDNIAKDLTECLKLYNKPGLHWAWNQGDTKCPQDTVGHEQVALGHFLLRIKHDNLLSNLIR